MRKLISFSLYGSDSTYLVGAAENVRLYKELLPDYTCVFYVGRSVPATAWTRLVWAGAEVHFVEGREDWGATLWRLQVLRDFDSLDRVIFRDCDSRPTDREVQAVRAWETSMKPIHVMRDHPAHHASVLAGMWGCSGSFAKTIADKVPTPDTIRMSNDYHEHIDQGWLEINVGPHLRAKSLQHCSYWTDWFGPSEPFPTERVGNEFVGAALKADGTSRYPDHVDLEALCLRCSCSIKCQKRN